MGCDRKTIPKFTKKQIAECEKCKHASGRKIWCCHFGVWIKEPERGVIIKPNKKIQYPSKRKMADNFIKSAARHIRSGFKKRTKAEIAEVKMKCQKCPYDGFVAVTKLGPRCKFCGCCLKLAEQWETKHCPKGVW